MIALSKSLIELGLQYSGSYIVSVEVPPGIGKTYYAIRLALEIASRGRTVIFALPNHRALVTAFAYAIKHFVDMMKVKKRRKMPYVVYYEGIQRFCPYFRQGGEEVFKRMLKILLKNGAIGQDLYDMIKDLSVGEVSRIYSSMYICKYLCPVYKQTKYFDKEKIFITQTVANQATLSKLIVSEVEKSEVLKVLSSLSILRSRNLVAEINPEMDISGRVGGYCLRAVLSKAITSKKTQLIMRGALILTPIHALDFVLHVVMSRFKALKSKGMNIPLPLVIIDEYDYYVYKPVDMHIFTLEQLKIEKELVSKVIKEERDKRLRGDPSYNWEKLVAALIAYKILSDLEAECNRFLEKYKKEPSKELLESYANIFIECATKPLVIEDKVYPPLAPRIINFGKYKAALADIYSYLEKIDEEAMEKLGVSFYDVKSVKSLGIKHFLALWENILVLECKSSGRKYRAPALYRSYGHIYRAGYFESDEVVSVAKDFAKVVMTSTGNTSVFYKVLQVEGKIYSKGKPVTEGGGLLLYGVYDFKLYRIFRSDADIALMSATGVPWLSGIFSTRSMGEGYKIPFLGLTFAGSPTLSAVYSNVKASGTIIRKGLSYVLITSENFSKPLLVIMLDIESLKTYALHGQILIVRNIPMLPPNTGSNPEYINVLAISVAPYVEVATSFMNGIIKHMNNKTSTVPSILVLTQRKDAALVFSVILLHYLSRMKLEGEASVCKTTECSQVKKPSLAELTREIEKVSHIVISVKKGGGEVFRFYITWLRSRMSRGIDLPDDTVTYGVMQVGTPYRPPYAFDILPKRALEEESSSRATYIEFVMFVEGYEYKNIVVLVHNPVDAAESVGEFVQAVGRALRRAWRTTLENQTIVYRVAIILPHFTVKKIFTYSPLWFQAAF